MNQNEIPVEHLLMPREYSALEAICSQGQGPAFVPRLAALIREKFAVNIVVDPDIVTGFVKDQSNLPGTAQGVARPTSARECAIILRACSLARIPLTISGGRSNLTGSATPPEGIILSLARMMSPPPQLDRSSRLFSAPVGLILEDVRNEVMRQSQGTLYYPVDPTSRGDSTIGGTIACNASGFIPGERGATREWVDAVDFLFPDGRLAKAQRGQYLSCDGFFTVMDGADRLTIPVPHYPRPAIKNAGGPFSAEGGEMDFVDWVVGSEGIYGVVTACTLCAAPYPPASLDLFIPLPSEDDAVRLHDFLHRHFNGHLGELLALEYFGMNCRGHMDHEQTLFRGNNPVAVYLQVPLWDGDLDKAVGEWMERLSCSGCQIDPDAVILLDNERDRKMFMESRHSLPARTLETVQHRGTFTIMTDTVVPPERFREFLAFTHSLLREAGMDYVAFGHLGDCHLHFTLLPTKANLARGTELYDAIVAQAAALGGVYSGEHGTGKRKRNDFLRCYGPTGVEQVLRCKSAVDPHLILNRGNVIP